MSIEDKAVIKDLSYSTSGTLILNNGKNIFTLENEEISFVDFVGNLKIIGSKFKMDGFVKKLDISGKSAISITS